LVPVSFFKKIITHFSLRREDIPNRKQTTSTKQTTCSLLHSYYFPHDLILKTTQSHCQLQAWIRLYNNQSSSRHHPWFLGDKPIFIISYRLSVFIIACRTQAGSRRHLRPFHLLVLASLWTKFSSSFPDFPRCSPLMSSFALLFFSFQYVQQCMERIGHGCFACNARPSLLCWARIKSMLYPVSEWKQESSESHGFLVTSQTAPCQATLVVVRTSMSFC
jgi:hypothetical protein